MHFTRTILAASGALLGMLALQSPPSLGQTVTQPPPQNESYQGTGPAVNTNVYGGGGWGGGYRSSTATGDALQGMSSAISAQGQRNLNNSMAARNMTEARSSQIDNQNKYIESYRWRQDSAKQRQQEEIAEMTRKSAPKREKRRLKPLTAQQYNPTTGVVDWPMLCRDPSYDAYRTRLNELLNKRAMYGGLDMQEFMEVEKLIKDWRMAITEDSKTKGYPSNVVNQALRFLLSLNKDLNAQFG